MKANDQDIDGFSFPDPVFNSFFLTANMIRPTAEKMAKIKERKKIIIKKIIFVFAQ